VHVVVPSLLDEQTPSGLSMHVQPSSQSASLAHAVTMTRHANSPLGVQVQFDDGRSSGVGSLESPSGGTGSTSLGVGSPLPLLPLPLLPPLPPPDDPEQPHSSCSSHVKPSPQSAADSQGSIHRGTH
jgi:hypothetical protein